MSISVEHLFYKYKIKGISLFDYCCEQKLIRMLKFWRQMQWPYFLIKFQSNSHRLWAPSFLCTGADREREQGRNTTWWMERRWLIGWHEALGYISPLTLVDIWALIIHPAPNPHTHTHTTASTVQITDTSMQKCHAPIYFEVAPEAVPTRLATWLR